MSATITDNPITISSRQTLAEYDIHHTGDDRGMNDMIVPPNTSNIPENVNNPSSWPRDQYRIPNYRPINQHLIAAERPNGSNGAERVFITLMFTGVSLNAGAAQVWGMTGGKVFTRVFRYAIGGKW
ncbi:uncharacterized protein EAE97_011622 [Botrytis byssoidea]|uniref:Uncharacterized protein n=1 Tax=Botrytis byssoidea TaxID=139641 RepID=A0A9P5HTB4_9HELO|nr:uncharacterized protein EAE97_011622 [Botrytis byssoidea]KAF7919704.1 hypothetical protein EAE97_011622 [Botrytis byssoidea]